MTAPASASQIPAERSGPPQAGEVTVRIGRWLAELDRAMVPQQVFRHAKLCILDALGCGLYGAVQPWGVIAGDVAVELGRDGPASLLGRRDKVSIPEAALANGTAIHGFELDDVHVASSYHPGCVTVPTCLAIAEAESSSGESFLLAVVAGYEIGIRVGICAGLSHSTSGFHVTGTVGAVGAAAAAACLLHLPDGPAANSIAIGATQASGLYAARLGAMAKRFHAGRAAQSGVLAGYLARRGFTGSRVALEAPFGGFFSTLHGQFEPTSILDRLGDRWETERVGFKAYAACASAHTIVDGLDDLMAQGLTPARLDKLTIGMSKKGATNVGWPYEPVDVVSAQMNGYFTAAVKLLDGEAFVEQYQENRLADPAILALLPRIKILHDPELDVGGAPKRHAVWLEARLNDGTSLRSFVEQRRGSAERPLSSAEIEDKFYQLAGTRMAPGRVDELLETVNRLDAEPDLRRLCDLVSGRNK